MLHPTRRITDIGCSYMSSDEKKELEQLREIYRKGEKGEPLTLEELLINRKIMRTYEKFIQAGKYGKGFLIFTGALAGLLVAGREIFNFFGCAVDWLRSSGIK